jgi:hypothetical protein
MDEKLVWKGEIEFVGTAEEYNRLSGIIGRGNVSVAGGDWWNKHHWPGLWPEPLAELIGMDRINELVADSPQIRLEYIKGIRGGIRNPHLHVGDQVVLVGREQFRQALCEAAAALAAKRVDAGLDYEATMAPVANLAVNG